MAITVFIPGALRGECDGASSMEVDLDGEARLSTVLDEVAARYPRLDRRIRDERGQLRRYVNIFIGAEESRTISGMESPVPQGAEVRVLPSVAGG